MGAIEPDSAIKRPKVWAVHRVHAVHGKPIPFIHLMKDFAVLEITDVYCETMPSDAGKIFDNPLVGFLQPERLNPMESVHATVADHSRDRPEITTARLANVGGPALGPQSSIAW